VDEFKYLRTNLANQNSIQEEFKFRFSGFGGLVVSMLASGTQVRGFKRGRSRRIFSGEKILSMPSFGGEVRKSVSHVAALRHVKEPYKDMEVAIVRLN
jgi:hypothetical protein